jgi:hypothetical protein
VCAGDLLVVLPDPEFPLVTVSEVDPSSLPPTDSEIGSKVFDVRFTDQELDNFSVKLCFASNSTQDACLGYLDENTTPPEWKCEDYCLSSNQDGQLCGDTSHFTNFAILLRGSNSADCESGKTYVTGSFNGDLALCLSVVGGCICLGILVILLASVTQSGRNLVTGKEGERVHKMRMAMRTGVLTWKWNY